jgi:hypothetical protein
MAVRLSALRAGLPPWYSFQLEAGRIRSTEKSNDFIGMSMACRTQRERGGMYLGLVGKPEEADVGGRIILK